MKIALIIFVILSFIVLLFLFRQSQKMLSEVKKQAKIEGNTEKELQLHPKLQKKDR